MDENKELLTEEQTAPEQPQKKKMGEAELVCNIIFLVIAGAAIAFFGFFYGLGVISMIDSPSNGAFGFAITFVLNVRYNSIALVALIIYFIVLRIKFKNTKLHFNALMVVVGLYSLYFLTYIIVYLINN